MVLVGDTVALESPPHLEAITHHALEDKVMLGIEQSVCGVEGGVHGIQECGAHLWMEAGAPDAETQDHLEGLVAGPQLLHVCGLLFQEVASFEGNLVRPCRDVAEVWEASV